MLVSLKSRASWQRSKGKFEEQNRMISVNGVSPREAPRMDKDPQLGVGAGKVIRQRWGQNENVEPILLVSWLRNISGMTRTDSCLLLANWAQNPWEILFNQRPERAGLLSTATALTLRGCFTDWFYDWLGTPMECWITGMYLRKSTNQPSNTRHCL